MDLDAEWRVGSWRPGDFSGDGMTEPVPLRFRDGSIFRQHLRRRGGLYHAGGTLSPGWQTFVTSFNQDALADVLFYNVISGAYFQGITTPPGSFNFFGGNFGPGQTIITNRP